MLLAALPLLVLCAQEELLPAEPPLEHARSETLAIRYAFFDLPYNIEGGFRLPSMAQSLDLTTSGFVSLHAGLGLGARAIAGDAKWLEELLAWTFTASADGFIGLLPFFDLWLHEEWHRAVMGRHRIHSHNGHYAAIGQLGGLIAVDEVADSELVRLKRDHLPDLLRLYVAGDEALAALADRIGRDAFFHDRALGRIGPLWFSDRRNAPLFGILWSKHFFYMASIVSGGLDDDIAVLDRDETTIAERDFAGPDFSAWARDLFRPDEPYEARGPHPTGVGLSRYTRFGDLRAEEQAYLELQTSLHFLNLIDPRLVGLSSFVLDEDLRFMASVEHELLPFGYAVSLDLLLDLYGLGFEARPRLFVAHDLISPGLDLELVELPIQIYCLDLRFSPRFGLWLQPKGLRFFADGLSPGALLGAELELVGPDGFGVFFAADAKSEGWVRGDAYLDADLSVMTGLAFHVR